MYEDLIKRRAELSHLTKKTIEIAQGYFDFVSNNPYLMDLNSYLDYMEEITPRYSDAIRAKSLVSGIAVKDLHARKDLWYYEDFYYELLEVCDLEKEAGQYISYDEWKQYEEEIKEFFVINGLYDHVIACSYFTHQFSWHGVERGDLTKLRLGKEVKVLGDDIIEVIVEKNNYHQKFRDETLAMFLSLESEENFLSIMRNYGKIPKKEIKRIGKEGQKPYSMSLHAIYMSGVMYRAHLRNDYDFGIKQEAMVAYYERILEILYKN